ncbi:hypothetical protein HK100_004165 [Physocladia obscura]|uniref:SAP domain-containing protein n=1 Tax=Physocladia obscura TaxID=109957 RepID=A0AAD5XCS6_9FUNG|nr:hypothetical protein HK100_004165 [Physocladia obscura]
MAYFAANTLAFPTLASLPVHGEADGVYVGEDLQRLRHWCFMAEITAVSFVDRPRISVVTRANETAVVESRSRYSPSTFAWTDLRAGHTVAILYAEKSECSSGGNGSDLNGTGQAVIRQDDLACVFVFGSGLGAALAFGDKLAKAASKTAKECFHPSCSRRSLLLEAPRDLGALVYCGIGHQREALLRLGQRRLLDQSDAFVWLMDAMTQLPFRKDLMLGLTKYFMLLFAGEKIMIPISNLSLELRLMKTDQLKTFCESAHLKTNGSKQELLNRAISFVSDTNGAINTDAIKNIAIASLGGTAESSPKDFHLLPLLTVNQLKKLYYNSCEVQGIHDTSLKKGLKKEDLVNYAKEAAAGVDNQRFRNLVSDALNPDEDQQLSDPLRHNLPAKERKTHNHENCLNTNNDETTRQFLYGAVNADASLHKFNKAMNKVKYFDVNNAQPSFGTISEVSGRIEWTGLTTRNIGHSPFHLGGHEYLVSYWDEDAWTPQGENKIIQSTRGKYQAVFLTHRELGFTVLSVSVHLPHKKNKAEARTALTEFAEYAEKKYEYDALCFGGDFNAAPAVVQEYLPGFKLAIADESDTRTTITGSKIDNLALQENGVLHHRLNSVDLSADTELYHHPTKFGIWFCE